MTGYSESWIRFVSKPVYNKRHSLVFTSGIFTGSLRFLWKWGKLLIEEYEYKNSLINIVDTLTSLKHVEYFEP